MTTPSERPLHSRVSALMVLTIFLVFIIAVLGNASLAKADSSLVQQTSNGCGESMSCTLTASFADSVTSGDVVVVGFSSYGDSVSSVTDTLGSTYSLAGSQCADPVCTYVYVATLVSGGSDEVTVTWTNADTSIQSAIYIYEVSGVTTSGLGVATGDGSGISSPSIFTSGSVSFQPGAFLLGMIGTQELSSPTAGTGFTFSTPMADAAESGVAEYSTGGATSPTSFPATLPADSSVDWEEVGVALEPSTSTSSTTTSSSTTSSTSSSSASSSSSSSSSSTSSSSTSSSSSSTGSTSSSSTATPVRQPPTPDVVKSLSISPDTGAVQAGTGGVLTPTLTAVITGQAYEADYPSAIVAGSPEGISVSFNPIAWESAPPLGTFTVTITISPTVVYGTYFVTFNDTLLPGGGTCSGSCVQPLYVIHVDPPGTPGIPIQLNLQDAVNATGVNSPPANERLSDAVNVPDTYEAPIVAALSDAVKAADSYVAPAVAALTDVVSAVDSYVAPLTAPLSDGVGFLDQLTKASPQATTALAVGLLAGGLIGLVLLRKRPDKEE